MSNIRLDFRAIPIKFFNTESRIKEQFLSPEDRPVTLYTCGPTVYSYAHIGNFRTYIFEDLLRRTLKFFGMQVKHVMNITDVDDKTIKGANQKGCSLKEYTKPFEQAFFEDLKTLQMEPADFYPEATAYIKEMIEMIQKLLDKQVAYIGGDGSVYYAITKFHRYGCLSHLKLNELKNGASQRVAEDEYDKEHLADFVLWKSYDLERDGDIFWESPFGPGRPGWHLECSAMAMSLLGETIDIHCGGVDNIFPHHENEIAQSEVCSGHRFVKVWMHSEHLLVDNRKMSKSLGNIYTLRDLLAKGYSGREVRYMLLHTHYKTQLNFTFEGMEAVRPSLGRLDACVQRLQGIKGGEQRSMVIPLLEKAMITFAKAMGDDLNISAALAAIFDLVREINILCDAKNIDENEAGEILEWLRMVDGVLGIFNFESLLKEIPSELLELLNQRETARAGRSWDDADRLRKEIQARGYLIEDTPTGARLIQVQ